MIGRFGPATVTRRNTMSSTTDKAKGYANEAAGKLRQGLGKVVGSHEMRARGAAQELKGKAQVGTGKAKDAAKAGAKAVDKSVNK